jgi:hypothetical protein
MEGLCPAEVLARPGLPDIIADMAWPGREESEASQKKGPNRPKTSAILIDIDIDIDR